MIYLAGAIAANLVMTFLMRYSENHQGNRYALNIWNYLAGFLFTIALLEDKTALIPVTRPLIPMLCGAVNGILFVLALVMIQKSIRQNGAPLSTTFNRLGILVPTILSAVLFLEIPGAVQIAGLLLAIGAMVYMNMAKQEERPRFMSGLLIIFLLGGIIDFFGKVYSRYTEAESQTYLVMYTFLAALLFSVFLYVRDRQRAGIRPAGMLHMSRQDILTGIGVGIPNQLTTLFLLWAAARLPAYIVYPTYSAGCIILVNVINVIAFRELLTRRQYIATALIGVALVLLNL